MVSIKSHVIQYQASQETCMNGINGETAMGMKRSAYIYVYIIYSNKRVIGFPKVSNYHNLPIVYSNYLQLHESLVSDPLSVLSAPGCCHYYSIVHSVVVAGS